MLPGSHRGQRLGACTDCRNNWAAFRAGEIDVEEISAINEELAPTVCIDVLFESYPLTKCEVSVDWNMWCDGDCEYNGLCHCRPRNDATSRRFGTCGLLGETAYC